MRKQQYDVATKSDHSIKPPSYSSPVLEYWDFTIFQQGWCFTPGATLLGGNWQLENVQRRTSLEFGTLDEPFHGRGCSCVLSCRRTLFEVEVAGRQEGWMLWWNFQHSFCPGWLVEPVSGWHSPVTGFMHVIAVGTVRVRVRVYIPCLGNLSLFSSAPCCGWNEPVDTTAVMLPTWEWGSCCRMIGWRNG